MPAALIPARFAQIDWHEDDAGFVDAAHVHDRRSSAAGGNVHLMRAGLDDHYFDNSAGACSAGWLKGDPRETPEGVFAEMMRGYGFDMDHCRLIQILRQLAKIEGCGWAATMADAVTLLGQHEGAVPSGGDWDLRPEPLTSAPARGQPEPAQHV